MYTVKHASTLTGVPVDTLRMWERRYGVVSPERGENGYRLYDDAAIARLTAMRALVEAGWPAGRAAMQVMAGTSGPVTSAEEAEHESGDPDLDLLVRLAIAFDAELLTRELDRVFGEREVEVLVDTWLMPALTRLGSSWRRGEISVAAEHFVSAGVHRRLAAVLDGALPPADAPQVLVGLARGSRHELGALAFAALLARAGLNVGYVGGDVPPDSWVVAAATSDPAAVVLAVPNVDDVPAVRNVVAALGAVRPGLPVFIGGGQQERVGVGIALGHELVCAAQDLVAQVYAHGSLS